MLLSKRDESRATVFASLAAPFSRSSPFYLRLSFLSAETHLKIYLRFALPRPPFPRVTLELAEIRGTTWGDGLLLDLRGFLRVNGGRVGEEAGGIKRRG